jgi:hypothetical protein
MTRGVVLFAHNNEHTDYYRMASWTAERVSRFLDLPCTIITDDTSITTNYKFDRVIIREPDRNNHRKQGKWINKGRYEVYTLTPYDDTIVLDTDYVINSAKLLKLFDYDTDFLCHRNCRYLMEDIKSEMLGKLSSQSFWATVIRFTKTERTEQIFSMIEMVQNNYQHYANIHGFNPATYRNDYALTIALRTVNGQVEHKKDFIPWDLLHVSNNATVSKSTDTKYNLVATINDRTTYITVDNCDFHMLHKDNLMEMI